jgi:flagellar M-ring protein FliF
LPEFLKGVGAARFGVMAGVAAALTAFFLYVAGVISEPAQSILFAGLDTRDASEVTAKLDGMNVPYTLKANGGTILVPADEVTKLRMEMASQNLPSAGVGYEIFDKSDAFGTTAFVQNINRLRALEGELARSIETIDNIDSARVHLVIPERQVFARQTQPPTASVVLRVRSNLGRGQVNAIQHLVAAAVSGLKSGRVAIVDDHGNLLAGGDGQDGPDASAAQEDQHTADYEDRLRRRIQNIVASVVGPGHVRVQVAADIKYNHVQKTSESYDPDSKVVRSTQTVDSSASDTAGGANSVSVANALPKGQQTAPGDKDQNKSSNSRNEETTNYEISKTVTTSTEDGGQVNRLSVAVVVDGKVSDLPNGKTKYTPRSKQEMTQIANLVKSAIGYDKARGDQVEVVNMAFARVEAGPVAPAPEPFLGLESAYWFKIIEAGILSLTALLIGFFIVRPLIRNMFAPVPAGGPHQLAAPQVAGQLPAPDGGGGDGGQAQIATNGAPAALPGPKDAAMIDVQRIDGQVRESSIKKVGEVVDAHPEEALAILRTWLHQPV